MLPLLRPFLRFAALYSAAVSASAAVEQGRQPSAKALKRLGIAQNDMRAVRF